MTTALAKVQTNVAGRKAAKKSSGSRNSLYECVGSVVQCCGRLPDVAVQQCTCIGFA